MSNPQIVTLSASGQSPGLAIDLARFSFGVGIVIGFSASTTAVYTVECSGDRTDTPDSAKLWVALPCLTNQNAAQTSNLAFPVTAVRLNASVVSGLVQLSIIQTV